MNTYGWDVVYARTIDSTNTQLKKYMTANEITFTYLDENTSATLTFDEWEIIPGGTSKLLRMKTLVKSGELTFMGKRTPLDGICPLVEIQLGFLHDKNRSNVQKLTFHFLVEGEREGDQREGAVTVIDPDVNNVISQESVICSILKLALAKMFIQNKEKMSYTFAELNISPDSPWMKPEKYKYSYYSPTSSDKGLLAIFSVVTNRDISKLDELIDGAVIDRQNDSFLVLSESLFLEHIIMPELPNSFGYGATINDLQFENTASTSGFIKNAKNLNRAPIRSNGRDHYPIITSLHVKIEGNKLLMKYAGKCAITGGPSHAYVKFAVEEKYILDYDSFNKKIEFTLEDGSSKVNVERLGLSNLPPLYKMMLTELANNLSDTIQMNIKVDISTIKTDVVKWSGMDFKEITDCVLNVAVCIKGKMHTPNIFRIVTSLNDTSVVDLSSEKPGDVHLWKNHGGNNQKWKFIYDEKEEKYLIESMTNENLLLAWNGSHYPRKVVVREKPAYKPYPAECYWTLSSLGGDYYEIINKGQKVYLDDYIPLWLDVDHSGTTNGTRITVHESNSTKAQRFKLKKV
ncbi:TULIP family P47-like protein [Bacillus thuringiensis]|uniref:TULIP family P47-like protein n=1 Tax=Bacillus thuringiensis TaxID=1428 RepID=UPI0014836528|nr:TULIP family P47-like protein [Bacillus thuringiensis]